MGLSGDYRVNGACLSSCEVGAININISKPFTCAHFGWFMVSILTEICMKKLSAGSQPNLVVQLYSTLWKDQFIPQVTVP